jgi:hypothetical protein
MTNFAIYDNGGKTWDRYTVIIKGSVYGMSINACMPDGFNQYCGEESELPGVPGKDKKIGLGKVNAQVTQAIIQRMVENQ